MCVFKVPGLNLLRLFLLSEMFHLLGVSVHQPWLFRLPPWPASSKLLSGFMIQKCHPLPFLTNLFVMTEFFCCVPLPVFPTWPFLSWLVFFSSYYNICDNYCLHLLRAFHLPGTLQRALFMFMSFKPYNLPVLINIVMPILQIRKPRWNNLPSINTWIKISVAYKAHPLKQYAVLCLWRW